MCSSEKLRELLGMKMNPKKKDQIKFELNNQGSNSFEEESSELDDEVELNTPTLRRYDHVRRLVGR